MNKKLQEIWDSAHEIPQGAYVPENTVLIQLDHTGPSEEAELTHYVTPVSDYWKGSPVRAPVRSVEPLPDHTDTGVLSIEGTSGDVQIYDMADDHTYDLTDNQVRNIIRKLTEAIDGN